MNEAQMDQKTTEIYALFDKKRKKIEAQETDLQELEEIKNLMGKVKLKIDNKGSDEK